MKRKIHNFLPRWAPQECFPGPRCGFSRPCLREGEIAAVTWRIQRKRLSLLPNDIDRCCDCVCVRRGLSTVNGNILSRTMHRMTSFIDHWFTNFCVWMLVCRKQRAVFTFPGFRPFSPIMNPRIGGVPVPEFWDLSLIHISEPTRPY